MKPSRPRRPGGSRCASTTSLAVLLCLLQVACAAAARERMEALERSIKGYNEAYRWKNFEQAAGFLPANLQGAFLASYEEDDKSLHVEGYQVLAVDMPEPDHAKVRVRYRYMLLPSVTLEHRVVTQHWARVNRRWVLEHEDRPLRALEDPPASEDTFGGPNGDPAAVPADGFDEPGESAP